MSLLLFYNLIFFGIFPTLSVFYFSLSLSPEPSQFLKTTLLVTGGVYTTTDSLWQWVRLLLYCIARNYPYFCLPPPSLPPSSLTFYVACLEKWLFLLYLFLFLSLFFSFSRRNWFLPGSLPPAAASSSSKLILDSVKKTSPNTRNYTFTAHRKLYMKYLHDSLSPSVPPNARIHLQPLSGLRLHSWSLEEYIPPVTPYGNGLGCYYIMYTRGIGEGNTTFWIEVEVRGERGEGVGGRERAGRERMRGGEGEGRKENREEWC